MIEALRIFVEAFRRGQAENEKKEIDKMYEQEPKTCMRRFLLALIVAAASGMVDVHVQKRNNRRRWAYGSGKDLSRHFSSGHNALSLFTTSGVALSAVGRQCVSHFWYDCGSSALDPVISLLFEAVLIFRVFIVAIAQYRHLLWTDVHQM